MKKTITFVIVVLLASLFLSVQVAGSDKQEPEQKIVQEKIELSPKELVKKYATEYNVSADLIEEIINLECPDWNVARQSFVRYKKDHPEWGVKAGDRERSFGLAQIHLPSHPTITYEQATNADFAIKFLASEISRGRGWQWSCFETAKSNLEKGTSGGKCSQ